MSKEELFKKYSIDKTHNVWEFIDSWYSVEICRIMTGNLPENNNKSVLYVLDFLDQALINPAWLMGMNSWGSLYLTAKRFVFKFNEQILQEMNSNQTRQCQRNLKK